MSVAVDDGDEELPLVDPFEPCVRTVLERFRPDAPPDEVGRINTLDTKSSVRISGKRKKCDRVEFNRHEITVTRHVKKFGKFSFRDFR